MTASLLEVAKVVCAPLKLTSIRLKLSSDFYCVFVYLGYSHLIWEIKRQLASTCF